MSRSLYADQAVFGTDPERADAVFLDDKNTLRRKALLLAERRIFPAVEFYDAITRPEPNIARAVSS